MIAIQVPESRAAFGRRIRQINQRWSQNERLQRREVARQRFNELLAVLSPERVPALNNEATKEPFGDSVDADIPLS